MSDTQSQLAEVNALIAASPDDPALRQLRDDLLQLIRLEQQDSVERAQPTEPSSVYDQGEGQEKYVSQSTFMEHVVSEAVAEAPALGTFQPVTSLLTKSAAKCHPPVKKSEDVSTQSSEKKKKKKKKKEHSLPEKLPEKFELPSHLVPLESDTPAQKLKKQRTAKALKSKFREKLSIAEHAKRQNEWTSFAEGGNGKKRKGGLAMMGKKKSSIFSTEDGVSSRVGVISGGGGRKMTDFEGKKRQIS